MYQIKYIVIESRYMKTPIHLPITMDKEKALRIFKDLKSREDVEDVIVIKVEDVTSEFDKLDS